MYKLGLARNMCDPFIIFLKSTLIWQFFEHQWHAKYNNDKTTTYKQTKTTTLRRLNEIINNNYVILQGLGLLKLSWDKNWDSHSLVNGYPSFYPRIALVAPSPDEYKRHPFSFSSFLGLQHVYQSCQFRSARHTAPLCILFQQSMIGHQSPLIQSWEELDKFPPASPTAWMSGNLAECRHNVIWTDITINLCGFGWAFQDGRYGITDNVLKSL